MNKRDVGVDILKFIAAILVVLLHFDFLSDVNVKLGLIREVFTGLAVPFFFTCSGYYFFKHIYNKDAVERRRYIKKYFLRLLKPFLIWGGCYIICTLVAGTFIDHVGLIEIFTSKVKTFIFESPGGGLWYIHVLLLILILIYVTPSNRAIKAWAFVFLISYIVTSVWYTEAVCGDLFVYLKKLYLMIYSSEESIWYQGVYFFVGCFCYEYFKEINNRRRTLAVLIMSFFVYFILYLFRIHYYLYSIGRLMLILLSALLLVYSLSCYKNVEYHKLPYVISNAGKISTVIYFTHFLTIYASKFVASLLNIKFENFSSLFCIISLVILVSYSCFVSSRNKIYKLLY